MSARTVRVRIAVAVDPAGNWGAVGHIDAEPREAQEHAIRSVIDGACVHWVEADVPVPESQAVQGVVTQDGA